MISVMVSGIISSRAAIINAALIGLERFIRQYPIMPMPSPTMPAEQVKKTQAMEGRLPIPSSAGL